MEIEVLKSFFLWCAILNYAILLLWLILLTFAKNWMMKMQSFWFPLSEEKFVMAHYLMFGGYKLAIIVFNLMPFIALTIIKS